MGAQGFSYAVLAGGKSSRMGQDKAELLWNGKTLLAHQLEKGAALDCGDIMVSGRRSAPAGTRAVEDICPDRGPLGGIYSCLLSAREERCLIVSVDVPQIPAAVLAELLDLHRESGADAALLRTAHGTEPLIGVYSTRLAERIRPLLEGGSPGVFRLLREISVRELPYPGTEELINCNTREDAERLFSLR